MKKIVKVNKYNIEVFNYRKNNWEYVRCFFCYESALKFLLRYKDSKYPIRLIHIIDITEEEDD